MSISPASLPVSPAALRRTCAVCLATFLVSTAAAAASAAGPVTASSPAASAATSFTSTVPAPAPSVAPAPEAACTGPREPEARATVTGRVFDPSGAAVPEAVVIVECGSASAQGVTDDEGRFRIEIAPGSYNVVVHKPGFEGGFTVVTVPASGVAGIDVALAVSAVAEEVTVTAGGYEQVVRAAPASVSVLGREALATRRFSSLAEAVADVEGVDVGQNVGKTGGMTISLRGMPSDYTLVLIDGRRQNAAGTVTPNGFGETATSFMPPLAAVERIEIVRGPMSTLYGSDAMGGVVNVITRRLTDKWLGSLSADGTLQGHGDFGNTARGESYFSGPLWSERVGVAARGSAYRRQASRLKYERVNGELVPITTFGMSPTRADIRTLGGRVSFRPHDRHQLYVDADGSWQAYDNRQRQLGTVGVQGGYQEELKFERTQTALAYAGQWHVGLLDASLTRNTTATIGRTIPPGTPGRTAGDPRTLEATNTLVDAKLVMPIGRHTLTAGGQWWDARMIDGVAPAPYHHEQSAAFAEADWHLTSRLALTAGLRYDHHSTFGEHLSPRGYLVFAATPQLTLKGGVSRGFKTPRLDQLADGIVGFGGQGTIPLIGSPGLEPETTTSAEISAMVTLGGLDASVTFFNNEFQDKIASGPGLENCSFRLAPNRPGCVDYGNWPNVDLFRQSVNVDEAVTRGVEASLRLPFLKRWHLQQNYTYTMSEQKSGAEAGQPLVNTPAHMYNATLRVRPVERVDAWLRVEARSSRTRGTAESARAATAELGPYKDYGLAHLGASYKASRHVTFTAVVYNLLDTDFLRYAPYTLNGTIAYASLYNNLQEPRRLWLSMNLTF